MAPRRKGTIPQRIMLTQATVDRIDAYQERHRIRTFSAAAEVLLRLGLEQSPTEVLTPMVTSAVHAAIRKDTDRLIRLLLYAIMESGTASRLAGATLYRQRPADTPLKEWNQRYQGIKEHAQMDARRALARPHITTLIEELYGDRESQLSQAESRDGDDQSDDPSGEVLHVS